METSLTPLDLKKQEFDRVFRGYDPAAVDAFLDLAAEEMGNLVARAHALEERLRSLGETVEDYRRMEQTLKDAMASAERLADESREAAVRDGELIRREAHLDAERIVAEAELRRTKLEQRIADLEARERNFIRKMKTFLDEHRQALEAHPLGSPVAEVRDMRGTGDG